MESALYIVSTPIGNLKDITLRALEILRDVDFVACEDTRVTAFLLTHYEIKKELISLNAVNENKKIDYIINRISQGESCALCSDAGTPGISDPGVRLISAAVKNGNAVVPIPGVTAAITALSASGLPTDSFLYEGFIPQKKGRQKKLKELSGIDRTIILYESTYRIEKLLQELNEYMPKRFTVVGRELTKKFEEFWRGYPEDLLAQLNTKTTKGEFVVIIAPISWQKHV
ncbi:MAG: 16S rRNA (cytidine(1402)-2'-O)-methyltransferase [Ignavibacteriaceae bacterium]|nr:16S rRNA (cytidine(1402)-2'-O)-methyltransferase [Ignavibacteriaceae bacterium]